MDCRSSKNFAASTTVTHLGYRGLALILMSHLRKWGVGVLPYPRSAAVAGTAPSNRHSAADRPSDGSLTPVAISKVAQ